METKKESRITDTLKVTLHFSIAFAVYWITSTAIAIVMEHAEFAFLSKDKLCTAFFAGVVEELLFRFLLISVLLIRCREKKQLYRALVISTVLFALAHGANIFYGAGIGVSILQMISSLAMGTAFGLLFLRTKNILPGMFLHTVHDIIALSAVGATDESGVITHAITPASVVDLLLVIAMGIVLFLCYRRQSETDRMLNLWKKKTNKKTSEGESE